MYLLYSKMLCWFLLFESKTVAFHPEPRKAGLCWQTLQKATFMALRKASHLWSKVQSKGDGPERGMFAFCTAYLGVQLSLGNKGSCFNYRRTRSFWDVLKRPHTSRAISQKVHEPILTAAAEGSLSSNYSHF